MFSLAAFGCDPPPFEEEFLTSEMGGWSVDNGVWQIGTPTDVGPEACHTPPYCAGTIIDGPYPAVNSRLISPTIILPEVIGELKAKSSELRMMKVINTLKIWKLLKISGIVDKMAINVLAKTPFTQLANFTGQRHVSSSSLDPRKPPLRSTVHRPLRRRNHPLPIGGSIGKGKALVQSEDSD